MKRIIQSSEIRDYIKGGDTLFIISITPGGYADGAVRGIEKSFLETGYPRDLTTYWTSSIRDRGTTGMAHLAHEGLLKKGIGDHLKGCGRNMVNLMTSNRVEIFNFSQSVTATMTRYTFTKKPGVTTRIGPSTMMDPRMEGGVMSDRAKNVEPQVELIDIHDGEWLPYELPKMNATLIQGSITDERDNISIHREGYKLNQLFAASAVKACGGIVIAQVEGVVKTGSIAPKDVVVPGVMMDHIFCAKPENHWQTGKSYYNPSFGGGLRVPLESVEKEMLNTHKVIARRVAMPMRRGDVCNLGVGIPEVVSSAAVEEGVLNETTPTTEAGNMGGMSADKHDSDCCWDPEAAVEMANDSDYYDGGCLDYSCLGVLRIDADGNVNVSRLDGGGTGMDELMDVAAGSKAIVFTTIFVGGVEVGIKDGGLKVLREGSIRKFLYNIEQISFNGELALKGDKQAYCVTERAVFRLMWGGPKLIEIAPGIDLQRDVLNQMDFEPIMRNVQTMLLELFGE